MEDLKFEVKMSVENLNKSLLIMGQNLIATKEDRSEFENLVFDTKDISDSMDAVVGIGSILVAAKLKKDEEKIN